MKKRRDRYRHLAVVFLVFAFILVLSGCGATPDGNASAQAMDADAPVFNSETLATFDGQDENPAYVAINGVVYDVTDVPNWRGGLHNGNTAGKDLTDVLGKSPHGETVLKDLPVVGTFE